MQVHYTKNEIEFEKQLSKAANEEGTIQADKIAEIFPSRPELHTTMAVSRAFTLATGKAYDFDFFCD